MPAQRVTGLGGQRRGLLLHGVGVAGEMTYGPMIPELSGFSEVLVPDLYGAGQAYSGPFELPELVTHLCHWLDELGWFELDLVGYSFGGLVAMLLKQAQPARFEKTVLIEPGLMERLSWSETLERRRQYSAVTQPLLAGEASTDGITAFLDLVSPQRSKHPRVERKVVARLAQNPTGLAYGLQAVSGAAESLDRPALLAAQRQVLSLVGGNTPAPAHALHQAQAKARTDWAYQAIPGCDHALPYQKPGPVAEAINTFIADDA